MSKTKEKQPIPKWFNGEIYDEGAIVKNPYSGEEYELNNVELSPINIIAKLGKRFFKYFIIPPLLF